MEGLGFCNDSGSNGCFIWERLDMPRHQLNASRCSNFFLFLICSRPAFGFVGLFVKLDRRKNHRVFLANDKIVAQTIDSVGPFVELEALLHAENARDLHLGQDDVLWQCFHQAVIQNLFWRR